MVQEKTKVATYWRAADALRQKNVIVEEERVVQVMMILGMMMIMMRRIKAGKIWSAGGVTSGIDAALAFLAARFHHHHNLYQKTPSQTSS